MATKIRISNKSGLQKKGKANAQPGNKKFHAIGLKEK